MPILAPETSLHPANLLDDLDVSDGGGLRDICDGGLRDNSDGRLRGISDGGLRKWWAVYTKSRQEKSLARDLLAQDVPFYLPLVPKVSMIAGRRVKSELPLFGSYLFLFATEEEPVSDLGNEARGPSVFGARLQRDYARPAQHSATDRRWSAADGRRALSPGRRVRIKHGSLMGLEGVIVSRRGEDRLLVTVDFLQQGVSILIGDFQVEPV